MAKILLVEDNPMSRDMLSRRLTRRGYEVVMAEDGQEGVTMAETENPAAVKSASASMAACRSATTAA